MLRSVALAVTLVGAPLLTPRASAQASLPLNRPGLQRLQELRTRHEQAPPSLLRMLLAPHPVAPAAARPIKRLLVKLKPGVDHLAFAERFSASARQSQWFNAAVADQQATPLRHIVSHPEIGWSTYEVATPEALQTTMAALHKDPNVLYVEPDYPVKLLDLPPPNNHYWGIQDWENTFAVWGLGSSSQSDAQSIDSTYWNFSWSMEQVSALQAWNAYPGHYHTAAERVHLLQTDPARLPLVGIIDTGVDMTHPDFSYTGNPSGGLDDTDVQNGGQIAASLAHSIVFGVDGTDGMDVFGHGTACAGIIAAAASAGANDPRSMANDGGAAWTQVGEQVFPNVLTGLGFPAQIVPIRIIDANGNGDDTDVLRAITYAVNAHCVILNMSLSLGTTSYPQALQDAVDYAWSHGTLIVAAAGNDGAAAGGSGSGTPRYPARNDKVLAVSATTYDYPDGGVPEQIASYSNFGNNIGVAAPGGDAQQYSNSATGDFVIDPIPEVIMPLTLQPTYTVALNDVNGQSADSQYAVDGFANLYIGEFPGTSFAAPHVVGLAALYAAEHRITQSTPNGPQMIINAIERGADGLTGLPNGGYDPTYGWGRINAAATIRDQNNRGATVGGIIGRVRYIDTVQGNVNVTAKAADGTGFTYNAASDADGLYHLNNMPAGPNGTLYNVSTTIFGVPASMQVLVLQGCDQVGVNLTPGLKAVKVKSLGLKPNSIVGSLSSTGTVTLSSPATSDTIVTLSTNSTAARVPANVTISAGSSSQTFPITTSAVSAVTVVTITASGNGSASSKLTLKPVGVLSVALSASSVKAGGSVKGTVTLQAAAGPGPITVTFFSTAPLVAPNPTSIIIPAGSLTGNFTVNTIAGTSGRLNIKATANGVTKASSALTVTK